MSVDSDSRELAVLNELLRLITAGFNLSLHYPDGDFTDVNLDEHLSNNILLLPIHTRVAFREVRRPPQPPSNSPHVSRCRSDY